MKNNIDIVLINEFKIGLENILNATRSAILDELNKGLSTVINQSELKADGTIVTDVDKRAENVARAEIARYFPDHAIVGEEYGSSKIQKEYCWYIDPIDGTQNLKHGIPTFGTVLSLYKGETPLVAAIDHPVLNLCYTATIGEGAFKNGRKICLLDEELGDYDVISFAPRYNFIRGGNENIYDHIVRLHPHFRVYYDCFAHSLTTEGALACTLDADVTIWDYSAAVLLIKEAGGGAIEFLKERVDKYGVKRCDVLMGRKKVVAEIGKKLRGLGCY